MQTVEPMYVEAVGRLHAREVVAFFVRVHGCTPCDDGSGTYGRAEGPTSSIAIQWLEDLVALGVVTRFTDANDAYCYRLM